RSESRKVPPEAFFDHRGRPRVAHRSASAPQGLLVTDRRENMAEIKGADLLAKSLKEQGVEYMFGVVGFPVGPIAEAAQKVGLPYIGMRNEQAASYAAGAVGYLTGRPGSCIVVTGPGVIHGLSGLANAQQNCWPMILIGGASETYRNGMGSFQEERQVLA